MKSFAQKGQEQYLSTIKSALQSALCLRDFPSVLFEKDNKPYIQMTGYNNKVDALIGKPIYIARNKKQQMLIQPAINSCRISFTLKKIDQIDTMIADKFSLMTASRAQVFEIMRRKPLKNYDITLLVTNQLLQKYNKDFIIQLILNLLATIQRDLVQIKLNINSQCRIASTYFMEHISVAAEQQLW